MPTLFDPIQLGAIRAPNRILMAPMTRARGTREHLPTPMMAEYYAQRASVGLIISEAIGITRQGLGWPYATGLWSPEQIAGWRTITDAVHEAGGRIACRTYPTRQRRQGNLVHSGTRRLRRLSEGRLTTPELTKIGPDKGPLIDPTDWRCENDPPEDQRQNPSS
jgi:hypothetical protein